ncbi:2-keto-4-pentenoate hydratase/2-oxohepta-3-ene-1,7-dioic acid hydratase in catechol pathway [Novosphingobium sp. PhB165]|uniref:fumarylacetoacetate hydrolase family protein n=1 Tax=Novosphingobium sp. PhB165 TaxID=2485105 RepID=UPI00104F99D9|nr:fumarylacetoacetate hydrolase family protein [Novosphingobium sp. PhB165]TCM20466.1 2-keto-4-pentenoate hydratase/2-oxohepta-3-ene-1,7-dioic acid hydratase in catechol pathway [Novosphingobium sp. PhB165]
MKICRFTLADSPEIQRLGIVEGNFVHDVTASTDALPALRWPFPPGDQLIGQLPHLLPIMADLAQTMPPIALDAVRLLSPVANPSKVVCGAGNWKHHGAPFGMIGFMGKSATAIVGAGTPVEIRWPDRTTLHEPELAIVIGRKCTNVSQAEALDYVAGYACAFDTTLKPEREDWAFCKSFDTYGTLGPWLVTKDEIPDPSALSYKFWVDDDLRGERSFADLTGAPAEMIAFASTAMTLYPGDIVLSGAADVGPIRPGETMTIEIGGIGRMSVPIVLSPHARAG